MVFARFHLLRRYNFQHLHQDMRIAPLAVDMFLDSKLSVWLRQILEQNNLLKH